MCVFGKSKAVKFVKMSNLKDIKIICDNVECSLDKFGLDVENTYLPLTKF